MSEHVQRRVLAALDEVRRARTLPELRELSDAVEELLRRAPAFDGDLVVAVRIGAAFAAVEHVVDELRRSRS